MKEVNFMDRDLRLKINQLISDQELTKTLLILCIAHLNDKITHTEIQTTHYENQLNTFKSVLIENTNVDEKYINEKSISISSQCYPTLKQINKVIEIIENGKYDFTNEKISKDLILFRGGEEIAIRKASEITEKRKARLNRENDELLKHIDKTFFNENLKAIQETELKYDLFKLYSKYFTYKDMFYKLLQDEHMLKFEISKFYNINKKWKFIIQHLKNVKECKKYEDVKF